MFAYHVVTDRPMYIGQEIIFDEEHHSGVYQRVYDKKAIVDDIYANPGKYDAETLEHHTSVALRELALEEVRQEKYPHYPSRMGCLYVSKTFEEADNWGKFFAQIGRPTYCIVKLKIEGNCFIGDATKCFDGRLDKDENRKLAEIYWENKTGESDEQPVWEMLVDGHITVVEIVKEINANIMQESKMIEKMISWAQEKIGNSQYTGWCLSFIEDALEISNNIEIFGGASAKESCTMYYDAIQSGVPERGAFVFYDCLCPSEDGVVNWGHCGISLGGGQVIHAWDTVRVDNFQQIERLTSAIGEHPQYIGWVPLKRVLLQKPDK